MITSKACEHKKKFAFLFCALLFFAGCGSKENYPEAYGVFYHDGTKWVEIGGATGTIVKQVPPDTRFLYHDKKVVMAGNGQLKIKVNRFIRNEVPRAWGPQTVDYANAKAFNAWNVGDMFIDAQTLPVKDKPEMLILKPKGTLASGVYTLDSVGNNLESVYVGSDTLKNVEASEFCFDLLAGHMMGNPPEKFLPCPESDKQTPPPAPNAAATTELETMLADAVFDMELRILGRPSISVSDVKKLLQRGASVIAKEDGSDVTPPLISAINLERDDLISA